LLYFDVCPTYSTCADHVFVDSDSNSLVTFIVGKEGETTKFTAHKEVVCYHSKVLRAAFNSNFVEGKTQTYCLEDTTGATFKFFMQWIYFQKLNVLQLQDTYTKSNSTKEAALEEDFALAGLWILGDRLCMNRVQNAALQAISDVSGRWSTIRGRTFKFVYDNTASGSLLQQYLVASCALMDAGCWGSKPHNLPHQMLVDFGCFMIRKCRGDEKAELDVSDYFVKED